MSKKIKCSNAGVQMAKILGGRWDGLLVEFVGPFAEFRGERYVGLLDEWDQVFYMPKAIRDGLSDDD